MSLPEPCPEVIQKAELSEHASPFTPPTVELFGPDSRNGIHATGIMGESISCHPHKSHRIDEDIGGDLKAEHVCARIGIPPYITIRHGHSNLGRFENASGTISLLQQAAELTLLKRSEGVEP